MLLPSFGNIRLPDRPNDGVFLNNAAFGGQSPTGFRRAGQGGFSAPENSLTLLADQPNRTGDVETRHHLAARLRRRAIFHLQI